MTGEKDQMGRLLDPAERYHDFLLGLFDLEAEAVEEDYSGEALDHLHEARLQFIEHFRKLHPGFRADSRAFWRDAF